MKECYLKTIGAFAGSFVDKLDALLLSLCESLCNAIFNCECHMVHTTATAVLFDEFCNRAFRGSSLKKLDLCVSNFKECCCHFLIFNNFLLVAFETQHAFIILDSLLQIWNGYSDVFNV